MSTHVLTADDLLADIQARGVRSSDLRDAVHEASHGLTVGAENWSDREEIHRTLCRRLPRPADLVREEIEARATEWEACERFGVPYDVGLCGANAAMEATGCGISMPLDKWLIGIRAAKSAGIGARRLDALIARMEAR